MRLGQPLTTQHYQVLGRGKRVYYWVGRAVGSDDVSGYRPNDEIDDVRWVPVEEATELLTYDRDRVTLDEASGQRRKTRVIVLLRHAKSRSRKAWRGDDRERPLLQLGAHQAERLVPVLAAYDVTRVLSSPSRRCVQTVESYAQTTGWELETRRRLSEEGATAKGLAKVAEEALAETRSVVLCTHRPVLPDLAAALGVPDPQLEPGEMVVLHLRKQKVVCVEDLRVQ